MPQSEKHTVVFYKVCAIFHNVFLHKEFIFTYYTAINQEKCAKGGGQGIEACSRNARTLEKTGEPWRIRTSDPLIKSQLLYQLS